MIMNTFMTLCNWWDSIKSSFSSIIGIFSQSLDELITIDLPIVSDIVNLVLSIVVGGTEQSPITLGDVSLFSFLFGSMISLFITLTIVKWFIGIIT